MVASGPMMTPGKLDAVSQEARGLAQGACELAGFLLEAAERLAISLENFPAADRPGTEQSI